jgi:hypothetical protein
MCPLSIPGVKDGQCLRLTTYQIQVRLSRNLEASKACNGNALSFPFLSFTTPKSGLRKIAPVYTELEFGDTEI